MAIKIALEGIDGSGKTSIARYLFNHRDCIGTDIACISLTHSENASAPFIRFAGKIAKKIQDSGSRHHVKMFEGLGYLLQQIPYRMSRFRARNKSIMILDRDPSVSHQVYAGEISAAFERFNDKYLYDTKLYPEVLIYLKTDVETSLGRVKSKGFSQSHENRTDLTKLYDRYEKIMGKIDKKRSSEVVKIDTNEKSLNEICVQVLKTINRIILK